MPQFDVVGVGLNATDTLLVVPHFPAYAGKVPFQEEILSPGGQVASAMVDLRAAWACGPNTSARWATTSAAASRWRACAARASTWTMCSCAQDCANQSAYIIIDRSTGERTVLWRRDDCLRIDPEEITPEQITCARLLHIDGHDTPAVEHAARIAAPGRHSRHRGCGHHLSRLRPRAAARGLPDRQFGIPRAVDQRERSVPSAGDDPEGIQMRVAAMTLGAHGALALEDGQFVYSPAFVVNCVDTTGAGDVFHGAFCYAVLQGMPMRDALDFSNAMAALNCTALGARGGIRGLDEVRALMAAGRTALAPRIRSRGIGRAFRAT